MASEDVANAFHGNPLRFVTYGIDDTYGPARKIATFEVAMKAEGLAVLDAEKDGARTSVKLVITDDNDPLATGIPCQSQTVTWVRRAK